MCFVVWSLSKPHRFGLGSIGVDEAAYDQLGLHLVQVQGGARMNVNGIGRSQAHVDKTIRESGIGYLRRSVTWLLRQKEIPYLKGIPNSYRRTDLDKWIDENLTTQEF